MHEPVRVNKTFRARMALRQQFGELDAGRTALAQLAHPLEDLDDPEAIPDDPPQPDRIRRRGRELLEERGSTSGTCGAIAMPGRRTR